ncbi:MAG: c-type cytochrome, partial [Verrucomicrobia bacterium]|nr:c-type cytochrome [Verrucomicrobiota bacterium]
MRGGVMMNFRSEGKALALAAAIAGGVLLATLGAATVMRGRVQSQQHLAARTAVGGGSQPMMVAAEKGRQLFLQSCAHCHGDDARGDDGPDLHNL